MYCGLSKNVCYLSHFKNFDWYWLTLTLHYTLCCIDFAISFFVTRNLSTNQNHLNDTFQCITCKCGIIGHSVMNDFALLREHEISRHSPKKRNPWLIDKVFCTFICVNEVTKRAKKIGIGWLYKVAPQICNIHAGVTFPCMLYLTFFSNSPTDWTTGPICAVWPKEVTFMVVSIRLRFDVQKPLFLAPNAIFSSQINHLE